MLLAYAAREGAGRWAGGAALAAVAVGLLFVASQPPWDRMMMTSGPYHYAAEMDPDRDSILEFSVNAYELLYYDEGLSSVVTVARNKDTDNIWLANNGKVDASTTADMPTQLLCALLPMQFVDAPDDVLVIGLASGITAGAVSLVDDVQRFDVVELEPAIETAARFFDPWNHAVLDDPRLNLVHNDGRNHVLLTPPETYDVIVSEPSNPWISGVSNLFTREFLELGKQRLKPGGVWSQWVQMYGMDSDDLRTMLKTFATVYPHVIVYATIEDADLVLVGSDEPLEVREDLAARLFDWPRVEQQLADIEIDEPLQIVSLYQLDQPTLIEMGGDRPLNTDDNMIIEYSAPLHLHVDTQDENFDLLREYAQIPFDAVGTDPADIARLARAYQARHHTTRAIRVMAEAVQRTDDPALREARLLEAEGWNADLVAEQAELEE